MKLKAFLLFILSSTLFSYEYQSTFFEHCRGLKKEVSAIGSILFYASVKEPIHDASKPAVLLVHGLSASPKHWHLVIPELEKAGFDVYTVYVNYRKPDGFKKSVERIREVATFIFKDHATVHLVGHSLGGVASVEAAFSLQNEGFPLKKIVTINSPLKGSHIVNSITKIALPSHLIDVLDPNSPYQREFAEKGKSLFENKTALFHIATETDHLVPGVSSCFFNQCTDKMILKGSGHLSALNEPQVHQRLITWLKSH